jgi:hypothetical protein
MEERNSSRKNKFNLMKQLLQFMEPRESLLQVLKRLGGKKQGRKSEHAEEIAQVTEIADDLMGMGVITIYEDTREDIEGELIEHGLLPRKQPPMFQYRWQLDGETFGPFTIETMRTWQASGYFQAPIYVRPVRKNEDGDIKPLSENFELLEGRI